LRDQTTDMSLYANTAYSMFPNATARNNFWGRIIARGGIRMYKRPLSKFI
jgi:hypothetical protein